MSWPSLSSPPSSRPQKTAPKSLAWVAVLGLGLVGLGIVASLTNPSQSVYEAYLSHQARNQLESQFCPSQAKANGSTLGLGQLIQEGCQSLLQQGEKPLQQLISHHSTRINLGLMSLYTTELPRVTQKQIWAVGFMGHIFLLQ